MRAFLSLALMMALMCFARGAQAQVHRCIGAQGEPVFTDQPCGPAELSVSLTSATPDSDEPTDTRATADAIPAHDGARIAATCPHSPEEIRDRIAVAFNDDNPSALAGLFDWRGFSHAGADTRLKEFTHWLKHPLVGVQFSGAPDPSGAQPDDLDYAPVSPSGVTVLTQSTDSTAPEAHNFAMSERGDCWWLSF